jgi:DNA-binding transcriptional LysR family regulator
MPRKLDSDSQIGRRLTLRDLHLFLTVVQHGSMASAAVQLGISQPNVSEVIADLEQALDARLFDRRPRGVEPTMYGEALLKRTRAVFDELRQGVKDIEFLTDPARGEVRIGFPPAAMATFLPDLIQKFSDAYPKVVLRISEVPRSAIYSVLRERTHDLHLEWCVPPFPRDDAANDVNIEYLFDDHFVIVAGPNTRWARRRKIDLAELRAERWMLGPPNTSNYEFIAGAFRARELAMPMIAVETLSVPLRTHLVASGRFIGAMPKLLASQSLVKILPVEVPVRPLRFAIFTLKGRTLSPAVARFIAHLRDFARSM